MDAGYPEKTATIYPAASEFDMIADTVELYATRTFGNDEPLDFPAVERSG
jgi:hypothetical protein